MRRFVERTIFAIVIALLLGVCVADAHPHRGEPIGVFRSVVTQDPAGAVVGSNDIDYDVHRDVATRLKIPF